MKALPALLLAILSAQESRPASSPAPRVGAGTLPPGAALEVDGEAVSEEEFGRWIARFRGDLYVGEFVAARLVRALARREGIALGPEEVDRRIEEDVAERVKNAFLGDREKWIREEVVALGRTMETFLRQRREEVETAMLVERLLAKRRRVTDEDVRTRWEERYGKGGRTFSLRHVLFETRYPSGPPVPAAETERRRHEIDEEVRKRAEAVRAQIAGGMNFAQAARAFSDDDSTKEKGGLVGRYTPHLFGPQFDAGAWKLKKGVLSDPIRSNRGWHLVEVTEETLTPLESVAAEVRRELETRRPYATEVAAFLSELLSNAKVVR
ncbi:MAG TPA: peptidylprolyl isomerase [Planctomycetota bacterium]|jgi:foldase protein PrsA|nr:peptidylprolyl isomerase [Planctomycetota bacterium]